MSNFVIIIDPSKITPEVAVRTLGKIDKLKGSPVLTLKRAYYGTEKPLTILQLNNVVNLDHDDLNEVKETIKNSRVIGRVGEVKEVSYGTNG